MANIKIPKPWENRLLKPTEEEVYLQRRDIIRQLGIIGAGMMAAPLFGCKKDNGTNSPGTAIGGRDFTFDGMDALYPATRNEDYVLDRPLSDPFNVTHFNNFYEFSHPNDPEIKEIFRYVDVFDTRDWMIEVDGLVQQQGSFHLGDLIVQMGLEERTYRHRCVEAWAMAVPWTGFPFAKLIEFLRPESTATHIRMETFGDPEQMQGIAWQTWYPWPYYEALRLDEAMNELAFIATGLYGKPLPRQNGAPIRLVVPWKYGFKSIKSIVKMTFTNEQPSTFWNTAVPQEYGITANVEPEIPHPRWSQEFETMITNGERRRTIKYNGYGEYVAHLYE